LYPEDCSSIDWSINSETTTTKQQNELCQKRNSDYLSMVNSIVSEYNDQLVNLSTSLLLSSIYKPKFILETNKKLILKLCLTLIKLE